MLAPRVGGSRAAGHCASSPSRSADAFARRGRAGLELLAPRRVEQAAARERERVAREPVRRAEVADRSAVELLHPDRVVPRLPQARPPTPATPPPSGLAGALVHRRRGEHRPRRAPHELPASGWRRSPGRTRAAAPPASVRRQAVRDEQDAGLAHPQRRHRPDPVLSRARAGSARGSPAATGAHSRRSSTSAQARELVERPDHPARPEVQRRDGLERAAPPRRAGARATACPRRTPPRRPPRPPRSPPGPRGCSHGRSVSRSWAAGSNSTHPL